MCDRVAVNNVAIQTLKIVFPIMGAFLTPLIMMGEKFNTPILDGFSKSCLGMFSRSPKARLVWKSNTNQLCPHIQLLRWWSKWEVLKQVYSAFGDIHSFLENDIPPSRLQMLVTLPVAVILRLS